MNPDTAITLKLLNRRHPNAHKQPYVSTKAKDELAAISVETKGKLYNIPTAEVIGYLLNRVGRMHLRVTVMPSRYLLGKWVCSHFNCDEDAEGLDSIVFEFYVIYAELLLERINTIVYNRGSYV